ncbi:MAG: mevalonate kinase [Anaerolineae bacterium]|nr:mevalonate kinase [Anaerolineae bacterium]
MCYTTPVSESTILGVGRAAGKVILFGEHAVVYGRPALAVPVTQVWAEATVTPAPPGTGLTIYAADLDEEIALRTAPADHPLAAAVRLALAEVRDQRSEVRSQGAGGRRQEASGFQLPTLDLQPLTSNFQPEPDWRITIRSTIPVASGLGSGAAVSAAIIRAIVAATQRTGDSANGRLSEWATQRMGESSIRNPQSLVPPAALSALVYEVERLHHGTPSGIDNTVIAYEQPVYFIRGKPPEPFAIGRPFTLVIADTGIRSPTRIAVGDVRAGWQAEPARFEALFDRVAAIVEAARAAIEAGEPQKLGPLMDENHALLQEMGVSCPELDALVAAARSAGASGAKLSGAGRGGNMIALVTPETAETVAGALKAAGATRVILTEVAAR